MNYHVARGVYYSVNMTNKTIQSLSGSDLHMSVIDGTAFINSAKVVSTDLLLNNGVLHVLEKYTKPSPLVIQTPSYNHYY